MADARRRHDWNIASSVMALTAEINRDRRRRRKPFKPDDFNPLTRVTAKPVPVTVAQLASLLDRADEPGAPAGLAEPPKPPALPEPMEPGAVDIPPVDLPGIDDPELQPPDPKELKLGIDPDAQASMDRFADGTENTTQLESAGNFDSRGLGLGSSARKLEPLKLDPIEPQDNEVKAGKGSRTHFGVGWFALTPNRISLATDPPASTLGSCLFCRAIEGQPVGR